MSFSLPSKSSWKKACMSACKAAITLGEADRRLTCMTTRPEPLPSAWIAGRSQGSSCAVTIMLTSLFKQDSPAQKHCVRMLRTYCSRCIGTEEAEGSLCAVTSLPLPLSFSQSPAARRAAAGMYSRLEAQTSPTPDLVRLLRLQPHAESDFSSTGEMHVMYEVLSVLRRVLIGTKGHF